MKCPRCGLQAYLPDRCGDWMCFACGYIPFDAQWLAAAALLGIALVSLFAHKIFH